MFKRTRLAGILGCAALVAMVGCSANSGVTPVSGTTAQQQALRGVPMGPGWIYKDGVLYHTPHYMATVKAASHVKQDILLTYGGGAVLVHPHAYLIYWGYGTYGDPNGVKPLLTKYIKVMGRQRPQQHLHSVLREGRRQDDRYHQPAQTVRRRLGRRHESSPAEPDRCPGGG